MLHPQVQQALDAISSRPIENVFLVACGGSSALMYPSKYLLDREAKTIAADLYSSNEFIHRNPVRLGSKSLVILCSHSGNTPETAEAAKFARSKGALTVSLTNEPASPLAEASEHVIKYSYGPDAPAFETNYSIMYQLVSGLLYVKEENAKFHRMIHSLQSLQAAYDRAKIQFADQAKAFAASNKDEKVIYTMASGANYGVAYSFAICILMEMQWIHSHAIHAGEYFHGPFEILDKTVPIIQLLGLDETRPLEERALRFSRQYGEKLIVIDAKEFDLSGIDEDLKGYISPLVLNYVLRLFANELADARNHPLSTRRYMWKVPY
ncbi:SIS domain-containing protein [Brevibacillus nitrificans]|uniref:SIS domain-containing protein n=1 Tax=Brevibacillus nitrificans TaxID=651560 RepID=UPI002863F9CF|nr:SIS domain-containing protein [Brevibacillus nitrificans]MDR7316416.1 fructoselysine 6-phosphate deglycase [Brevibacillus nitrificans]